MKKNFFFEILQMLAFLQLWAKIFLGFDFLFVAFLRTKAATALVHLSHCNSVHLSHGWISQKRGKLGSPDFHCRLPGRLVSGMVKLFHKFEGGHPEREC